MRPARQPARCPRHRCSQWPHQRDHPADIVASRKRGTVADGAASDRQFVLFKAEGDGRGLAARHGQDVGSHRATLD
jgi:hypothetical protein